MDKDVLKLFFVDCLDYDHIEVELGVERSYIHSQVANFLARMTWTDPVAMAKCDPKIMLAISELN